MKGRIYLDPRTDEIFIRNDTKQEKSAHNVTEELLNLVGYEVEIEIKKISREE